MTSTSTQQDKATPAFSVHLDAVRGLAALSVFFGHGSYMFLGTSLRQMLTHHAHAAVVASAPHFQPERTHFGRQAVVVFFVLSGYLVGGGALRSFRNRIWSWRRYLLQRLTRLWVVLVPALLLTAALVAAASHLFPHPIPGIDHASGTVPASVAHLIPGHSWPLLFVGNLFFLQGVLVHIYPYNGPLWSLAYEFWYYMMFPLLLFGLAPSTRLLRRACCLMLLIGMWVLCGKIISLYFLLWLMGVAVYWLPVRLNETSARRITPWLCIAFLGFNVWVVAFPFDMTASDFCTGVCFSLLLWVLVQFRKPAGFSLYRSASTRLSAMSYTLYVSHFPLLLFLSTCMITFWPNRPTGVAALALLAGAYAAVFAICYAIYCGFEAHTTAVRKWASQWLDRSTRPAKLEPVA